MHGYFAIMAYQTNAMRRIRPTLVFNEFFGQFGTPK
jgi:hypothetical protein